MAFEVPNLLKISYLSVFSPQPTNSHTVAMVQVFLCTDSLTALFLGANDNCYLDELFNDLLLFNLVTITCA